MWIFIHIFTSIIVTRTAYNVLITHLFSVFFTYIYAFIHIPPHRYKSPYNHAAWWCVCFMPYYMMNIVNQPLTAAFRVLPFLGRYIKHAIPRATWLLWSLISCAMYAYTHTHRDRHRWQSARARSQRHNDDRGSLVGLRALTKTGFARWNNMCGVYTIYVLSVRALLRQYTGKKCIYLSECVLAPTQDLPCRCLSARGTCERSAVGVEHAKHTSTHAYARVYTPLHILSADPSEARRTASRALSIRAPKSFGPHGGESSHMPAIIIHGLGSQNVEGILWNELLRIDRNCGTIGL